VPSWVTNLPLPAVGAGMVLLGVAIAVIGLLSARRLLPLETLASHHDITGAWFQVVGTLYAVLLAFIVITVWQRYDSLTSTVELEAANVLELFRDTREYPPELHDALAGALHAYVAAVVGDEWDAMSRGGESATAQTAFERLWGIYRKLPVRDERELAAQIETMRRMNDLSADRHLRLLRSRSKIPPVLWLGLLGGALLTMAISYFFGARSATLQIFLTAGFAGTISLFIFVIVILDTPFAGAHPISREPFLRALRVMAAETH
jgi:Protein of unknown function (DUF4239)